MSFVVKAIVYMTAAEFDAVEVKRGDILYVVDYGDRLRSYLGDIPVESLTFSDFTQDQIDEIKSAAQEAAEASAAVAVQAADAASASENAAKGYMDSAKVYADKATLAEGYDESARKAATSALNSATSANTSLLRTIAERVLAQSYAIGGTNTRPGEDTDNAKYYMRRAQAAAEGVDQDFSYIESIKDHVDEQSAHVDDVAQTTEGYMDAAEAAKQAAETAQGKAETAQSKAEDAQGAAEAAQQAAETAQGKAENAQQAAETAQGKAEDSQDKAEIAQGKAEDAQQAAETAQTAAETAQGKAEDAQDAAEAAQTAAETAQGKAEDAQTAAETAQGKAEDAQQAAETAKSLAETAQGKAEDAQQAAEDAQSAAETAQGAAEEAQGKAEDAQQAAETAQGKAEDAQGAAERAQGAAETAQGAADGSATAAAASAKLSESWAIGGTGTREGEDENNAKYYAEQSRQFSPENKADKPNPLPEQDGVVAALTTEGNLQATDVPASSIARQDGYYGAEGLGAHTAEQLVDPNAPATERKFGFDTAAGNITISDNGTGVIDKLMGTTHVANQLVHDTNMNTKSSTDGKLVLTDAVGGNLSKLEIHGGCVVHNQLVKESVEKTVTGTGRLGCDDGVAGNAKSLVITAPRSVVMNQLVNNGDFSDGTIGYVSQRCSLSASNNILTVTLGEDKANSTGIQVRGMTVIPINHKAIISFNIKASKSAILRVIAFETTTYSQATYTSSSVNIDTTDVRLSFVFLSASYNTGTFIIYPISGSTSTAEVGDTFELKNIEIVDLTQYFNGNTTLINSITSWDDLVAYDSSFASYVPYETGTVKGVQPTVKVNHTTDVVCPVELFGVSDATGVITGDIFDGVSGVVTRNVVGHIFTGNESITLGNWRPCEGYFAVGFSQSVLPNKLSGALFLPGIPTVTYNELYNTDNPVTGICSLGSPYSFAIRVPTSIATDNASLLTWLTGQTIYYATAEPTTSQYNPTTIPTVDIYNSAVQTAGTRPCPLSLTYYGREQTITLDPTHTYVFNDNQIADSLITEQSSIDAVGGEDMLVDVTQLYNGDSTRISQIHRWASLSTRFHRYRDLMPYNPGTVEPDTPVIRNYPDEYAYGVVYDPNQSSPACVKVELRNGVVSEVTDFSSMSCHQLYRCVMDDLENRHIAYYLDDEDSNKKYNGTRNGVTSDGSASVLTGADGDVMVEIPISYWYLDEDYNGEGKVLWLISDRPFMGTYGPAEIHDFFYVSPDGATCRTQYVGAYKASVCNADGTPINTTEGALAQSTGTASTNIARSIAGVLPYVNVNQNDLLARAKRNNASTVNTQFHQWLMLLMVVEQGSLNTQLISQGYSNGIQNAFCFWRKSGRVNAGNGTAEILADENSQDMDNFQSLKVGSTTVQRDTLMDADGRYAWSVYNRGASSTRYFTDSPTPVNGDTVYSASTGDTTAGTVTSYTIKAASARVIQWQYRGIENPFGEVWEFEHGIQKYSHAFATSIKYSNVVYYRDPTKYGANSFAWTTDDGTTTIWSAKSTTSPVFSDENLTTQLGTSSVNSYRYDILGYWETLSTTAYTGTEQQTAANPSYTWRRHRWPMTSGWIKKFDPRTFFNMVNGGSGSTYLPDYYYDNAGTGSRVVYVGGGAYYGSGDGLACRYVGTGLAAAYVYISGRLSA